MFARALVLVFVVSIPCSAQAPVAEARRRLRDGWNEVGRLIVKGRAVDAVARADKLLASGDAPHMPTRERADAMHMYATALVRCGRTSKARPILADHLAAMRKPGVDPAALAIALVHQCELERMDGKYGAADLLLREIIRLSGSLPRHWERFYAAEFVALAAADLSVYRAAIKLAERTQRDRQSIPEKEKRIAYPSLHAIAAAQFACKRFDDADRAVTLALRDAEGNLDAAHPQRIAMLTLAARIRGAREDRIPANLALAEARAQAKTLGANLTLHHRADIDIAEAELALRRNDAKTAIKHLQRARARYAKHQHHPRYGYVLLRLAETTTEDRPSLLAEALAVFEKAGMRNHEWLLRARILHATVTGKQPDPAWQTDLAKILDQRPK